MMIFVNNFNTVGNIPKFLKATIGLLLIVGRVVESATMWMFIITSANAAVTAKLSCVEPAKYLVSSHNIHRDFKHKKSNTVVHLHWKCRHI